MSLSRSEKLQRSVESLERLFSAVLGLAITVAVQKILFDPKGNLHEWYNLATDTFPLMRVLKDRSPAMLTFLASVIPFYHAKNCHLDRAYLDGDIPDFQEWYLLVDIIVFFVEACILVAIAALVDAGKSIFLLLIALYALDTFWCFATDRLHFSSAATSARTRGFINALACISLSFFFYNTPWFPNALTQSWVLCYVVVIRSVTDYFLVWNFYFPPKTTG